MPAPRKRYRSGEPFEVKADDFNALIAAYRQQANLGVVAPLTLEETDAGRVIGLERRRGFWAKLTAEPSAGAYSWTRQHPSGSTWVAGVETGVGNGAAPAYEVNAVTGLSAAGGQVVWLEPGFGDDYRFQMVRRGAAPSNCPGSCNIPTSGLTVTYYNSANGNSYPFALTLQATNPTTVYGTLILSSSHVPAQYWTTGLQTDPIWGGIQITYCCSGSPGHIAFAFETGISGGSRAGFRACGETPTTSLYNAVICTPFSILTDDPANPGWPNVDHWSVS